MAKNNKYIPAFILSILFCVQSVLAVDGTVTNIDISGGINSAFIMIGIGFVVVAALIILKLLTTMR